jgi:hypothetical protein
VRNEIYDVDNGVSLFSTISFNTGDVIAEFHGEIISREKSVSISVAGDGVLPGADQPKAKAAVFEAPQPAK